MCGIPTEEVPHEQGYRRREGTPTLEPHCQSQHREDNNEDHPEEVSTNRLRNNQAIFM